MSVLSDGPTAGLFQLLNSAPAPVLCPPLFSVKPGCPQTTASTRQQQALIINHSLLVFCPVQSSHPPKHTMSTPGGGGGSSSSSKAAGATHKDLFDSKESQLRYEAYSRLQAAAVAFGDSCSLPIPEIVAIGGQSDGKSSLMEAFLGVSCCSTSAAPTQQHEHHHQLTPTCRPSVAACAAMPTNSNNTVPL